MPVVAEIAGRLGPHLWCTRLQRRNGVYCRRLLGVIDLDQLGGVARLPQRPGNDDGDLVADVPHAVGDERRMRRLDHRRAVLRVDLPAARQSADFFGGHVLAGIDRHDPRGRGCRRGVDPGDPGVGVRAAQDIGVELPRAIDVVGVGALTGDEAVILTPPYRRSGPAHRRYSAATPWTLGGVSPRITAAPSMIASTMLW